MRRLLLALLFVLLSAWPASATTISESFNKANGALGPDLTWTSFASLQVVSNTAQATAVVNPQPSRARAESNLSTANQFAQATVRFNSPAANSGAIVLGRFSSAAETGYEMWLYTTDAGLTYFLGLYSMTAGTTGSALGTDVNVTARMAASNVLRIEVAGTSPNITVVGSLDGVAIQTVTGLTLNDGNVRTGIGAWRPTGAGAGEVSLDDFSAGDLAPGGVLATCSQINVMAAIDQAADGGTVTIPAGDCTWTGNITMSKRLIIRGAGDGAGSTRGCGSCATVIHDDRNAASIPPQLFIWNVPADSGSFISSMSGIAFRGLGYTDPALPGSPTPTSGMLQIIGTGSNKRFRLHHMEFFPYGTSGLVSYNLMGVVDHSVFHLFPGVGNPGTYTYHPNWLGAGGLGDNSWAQPSTLGTDQALYFEDNDFLAPVTAFFGGANDDLYGARVVYRHNTYTNQQGASGHGTESGGRARGFRHHEVYENDITYEAGANNTDTWTGFRSGTGVMFNNRVVINPGAALNRVANIGVDRAGNSGHYEVWGRCGQYNVSLTSSGTTATATITNPNADGLGNGYNLSGASPTPIYVKITGATDSRYNGTWPVVTPAPFGETFQFTTTDSNLIATTGVKMAPWDQNTDTTGYACLDQAGRGLADNWNGANPPASVTWPNNALEPIYYWNNTIQFLPAAAVDSPIVPGDGSAALLENRDFYNGIAKPGYTPFTYPHPLVTDTGTPFVPRHFIIRHRGP